MTPASQKAAADALAEEMQAKFREGALAVGFSLDNIARFLLLPGVGPILPKTDAQRRLEASLSSLGARISRWERVYRSWAERGTNDDGKPYTWEKWTAYAREDLAREVRELLGTAVSESLFLRFTSEVVVQSVQDTARVVNPLAWPTWAKVAAGATAAVVVLAVLRPYLTPVLRSA